MGSGGRKHVPGKIDRADRMAAEGLYSDASRAARRLTNPELRIKDQDRDGIQAEVLYGILGAVNRINDTKAAAEVTRIYNDWLAGFCKSHPDRLIGLGLIPGNNVQAAVFEAERLAKLGIRGIEMSMAGNAIPLFELQWDPLWAVMSEAHLPLHLHITPFLLNPDPPHWTVQESRANNAVLLGKSPLAAVDYLMQMMFGGALERFPNLRMVFAESGVAWIPYVLDRMDFEWGDQYKDLPLKMKPSEYWKRQCKATFQYDAIGMRLLDLLGEDTLMWGSDFPHPDGVWPDSQEYIRKQFSDLPDRLRRKIICDNAVSLYRL
jgi:predicted TIM-barrel fold metal-dependent hydrolase